MPQANTPTETPALAWDDLPYVGMVTESAAQWGQRIDIGWSPKRPTNRSVRRMVDLLRRTADELERGLIAPPVISKARGEG